MLLLIDTATGAVRSCYGSGRGRFTANPLPLEGEAHRGTLLQAAQILHDLAEPATQEEWAAAELRVE